MHVWRLGVRDQPLDLERALHELKGVEDPRIRTGYLNQYAYNSILWGQYDTAYEVAQSFLAVIEEYRLTWAQPHAEWALATAALGRRQFALADGWLRKVEQAADQLQYGQLVLNASCVRCRMLLALNKPREARSALVVDETLPANPAMRGEFLATRALVLAVLGDLNEAVGLARAAREMTISAEAHAYASCVESICAERRGGSDDDIAECVVTAGRLEVWDALVVAVRSWPLLLTRLASNDSVRGSVVQALRKSNDYDLARQAGLDLGRRPTALWIHSAISPREREVLELVRQGFTNAEIARTLFISQATVKAHVRHILEKTGARSRTEAATRLLLES
jgi:DNA-binding CsgD family transcriptional regulator